MNTIQPALLSPEELLHQLNWRYAVKEFDASRRIEPATWAALEETLRLAPSSGGLQPWNFVVVTDPDVRTKLIPASYGQTKVRDSSHLVVFAAKTHLGADEVEAHVRNTSSTTGTPLEALGGLRGMLMGGIIEAKNPAERVAWAAQQAHVALGFLLAAAAIVGVDAAPMGGFVPEQYDEILHLKERGLTAAVICALGYRAENDRYARMPKVRFPHSELFLHV